MPYDTSLSTDDIKRKLHEDQVNLDGTYHVPPTSSMDATISLFKLVNDLIISFQPLQKLLQSDTGTKFEPGGSAKKPPIRPL